MALLKNKKATLNFEIIDKIQGGLKLHGFEVKTIKSKQGSMDGSYLSIIGNEIFLKNCYIPPYQIANTPNDYDSRRNRKVLITKKEIRELIGKEKERGLTLIPLSLYNKGNKIKVEFAIARGKKKRDKREDLKRKEADREINRTLKNIR